MLCPALFSVCPKRRPSKNAKMEHPTVKNTSLSAGMAMKARPRKIFARAGFHYNKNRRKQKAFGGTFINRNYFPENHTFSISAAKRFASPILRMVPSENFGVRSYR